jgi:hypothetical protein
LQPGCTRTKTEKSESYAWDPPNEISVVDVFVNYAYHVLQTKRPSTIRWIPKAILLALILSVGAGITGAQLCFGGPLA